MCKKNAQHHSLLEGWKSKLQGGPHIGQDGHHHPKKKKMSIKINAGEGIEKREPPLHSWWDCKLIQPLWKTVWRFLWKLGIKLPYGPATPLQGLHPEETSVPRPPCAERHSMCGFLPGHAGNTCRTRAVTSAARGENCVSEGLCFTQSVSPLGEKPQLAEQAFPAQCCGHGAGPVLVEGAALALRAAEQHPGPATRLRTTGLEQRPVEQGLCPWLRAGCAQVVGEEDMAGEWRGRAPGARSPHRCPKPQGRGT